MKIIILGFFVLILSLVFASCGNEAAVLAELKKRETDSLMLNDYNRNMAEVRDILDTMAIITQDPNNKAETVREKASAVRQKLQTKMEKIAELQKDLEASNATLKSNENFIAMVQNMDRLNQAQQRELDAMVTGASSRQEIREAGEKMQEFNEKVNSQQKIIKKLETEIRGLQKENDELKKINAEIIAELGRLRADSVEQAEQIVILERQKAGFDQILADLQNQINSANSAAERAKQEQIYELLQDGFSMYQASKTMKEGSFWTGRNKKKQQTLNKSETVVQAYQNFCKAYQLGHSDAYNHMQNLKKDKNTSEYLKNINCN